jgi:hypothetical protein
MGHPPKYLEEIRAQAEDFSTKRLARQSRLTECTIRNFKNGKGTIRSRSLRKLTRAILDLLVPLWSHGGWGKQGAGRVNKPPDDLLNTRFNLNERLDGLLSFEFHNMHVPTNIIAICG